MIEFLRTLMESGSFDGLSEGRYIEMLNQVGHGIVVGAAPAAALIAASGLADRHRALAAVVLTLAYLVGWEIGVQGYAGADTFFDAAFVGGGALLASLTIGAQRHGAMLALGIFVIAGAAFARAYL